MADIKVLHDDFSLTSRWNCKTTYFYNSYGSFNSASNTTSGLTYGEHTARFAVNIPSGAKVSSAKVYASYTRGSYGGKLEIAGIRLADAGFVTLESPDLSSGYVDVVFRWTSYTDGSSAHSSTYPTYNGSSSQSKSYSHTSETNVSNVYLLVEYELRGLIYHAENGQLVPYQIYRAENGQLVPYQLFRAENNALVLY